MCARAGGGHGPLLWPPRLPAEQLERPGRAAGVRVAGGHPGVGCVSRRKSNLRNPPRSAAAANAAAAEVRTPPPPNASEVLLTLTQSRLA